MKKFIITLLVLVGFSFALADGLMVPTNENYPKDFMMNRVTRVTININSLMAETIVYQEFLNESNDKTDAVYSFPLPPNARATEFLYWQDDTIYKAVLKVKEQAVNPGTGEGGIIAEVNEYIGRNGIKIALRNIKAGEIQKVRLTYVQHCDYYLGKTSFKYPLDTSNFIQLPLDHLQFTVNINSITPITGFGCTTHTDYNIINQDDNHIKVEMIWPKSYQDRDIEFWYNTVSSETGIDFYSVANDSTDGHFCLFVLPKAIRDANNIYPKRIIFLLDNSSNMAGYVLDQSIKSISHMIELLQETDYFNILLSNYSTTSWQTVPVPATEEYKQAAKTYLEGITTHYGSNLGSGLDDALLQIKDDTYSNAILTFTNGYSTIDPKLIESNNTFKTGIFPIGVGENISYERLEMLAALNYGFVTYFNQDENLYDGMTRVFEKISKPILKEVAFEFGELELYDVLPEKLPTTYSGTSFFMTGRYSTPGSFAFAMAGKSPDGTQSINKQLDFNSSTDSLKVTERFWAKEKIDALEQEIEIYGETADLKEELISISLAYNIRCRYTAYIADYETPATSIDKLSTGSAQVPESYLVGNYPNPFNPTTTIRFYLSPDVRSEKTKLIKIFNALGQLVSVIDISHLEPGMHEIRFNGIDFYGNALPSGTYIVFLQIGDHISSTKITLLK